MKKVNAINNFKLWEITPNTIDKKGAVYTRVIRFNNTFNKNKNRTIRVYLPSTYDFDDENKRFPVIYMFDGKNLFDDHTSFVGEWGVDEAIEDAIKHKLSKGIIAVGIDAPRGGFDRQQEMTPNEIAMHYPKTYKGKKEPGYANVLGEYVVDIVKKIIDETFHTLPDAYHTAIGGSSMGGLMSFYMGMKYPEVFQNVLSFSPAFFLHDRSAFKEYMDSHLSLDDSGCFYFYVGGKEFEEIFVEDTINTYKYLRDKGFDNNRVKILFDSEQVHNEAPWRKYFIDALRFIDYLN